MTTDPHDVDCRCLTSNSKDYESDVGASLLVCCDEKAYQNKSYIS